MKYVTLECDGCLTFQESQDKFDGAKWYENLMRRLLYISSLSLLLTLHKKVI